MEFRIAESVATRYPNVRLGLVVVRGLTNNASNEAILSKLAATQAAVRADFATAEDILEHPSIARWRKVYDSFGANPNKFRNSAEALLRRVVNGKDLPHINSLVDIYNTISIKYRMPAGGDDLANVAGDIVLDIAQGGELFTPFGAAEPEAVDAGEVIYHDNTDVLCRRWNWRESAKTCMSEQTTDVCLVLEVLDEADYAAFDCAMQELAHDVHEHCGGTVLLHVLSASKPTVSLH